MNIAAENAQPGTPNWNKGIDSGSDHGIEGYDDQVAVTPGQSFKLFVSTTAPQFTATAFRIGYYGGTQARQVWKSAVTPGKAQPAATVRAQVNTVSTTWQPSMTVATDGWPEGSYLIRLDAVGGKVKGARFVPVTVRSTSTAGKVVLINGVTTWQAYNSYGGYDLYSGGARNSYGDRARIVSFDRPYDTTGADRFQTYEQSSIVFSEKLAASHGFELAYATDLDLHEHPGMFQGARAIITLGHDEYWSTQMRQTVTQARDSGTNLAFLGANAVFRHIRFQDSPLGKDRIQVDYKDAAEDPMHVTDPAESTQDWRYPPNPRPENVLTGVFYECNPANANMVVFDPDSWLMAGTGAKAGQSFKGLVGIEYDRVAADSTTPHPIEALTHSPITCQGKASYSDSAYYTVPSGAGVFATGTMRWNCALVSGGCTDQMNAAAHTFAQQVTTNMLLAFAAGPAGKTHPATDNTARLKPTPSWGGVAP
ncbi:N,N-dimethylformamidase beta subunit family domain-containing protein [Catenulispora acidiphila]|uniref:N,N-dimethylformamidase beta subunit family domain-containing protein n=1 Tax=Catenulispora acidiphila TaxID=304895 RepID=UPI00117DC49A|nr:N,N-dimethylformamidase beta subunit family domain-containing protein [Catenulispora acidiphila]